MKLPVLFAAVVLALTSITARAEVLIYKGNVRLTDLDLRKKPFVRHAYLVTDPTTGSTQLVTYGKVGRTKTRESEPAKVGDYFGGALALNGPLVDVYSFLFSEDGPTKIRESLFLRGYQKTLHVSTNQGDPEKKPYAKFLKGSSRVFISSTSSSYVEREISLTFDKDRTIDAN
ncbi:MAG TPA: hypothetical protein VFG14_10330, partial [Chthoniobacteraceae bacterium]|nr:hypothetical protein [Chthoniobacteraceae bacterium]